jgi:2-polyprenyl-3-methyl-5-hydroxy-6-metoxy-1,4-benzoquinol methylase
MDKNKPENGFKQMMLTRPDLSRRQCHLVDLSYYQETRHEMMCYLPDSAKTVLDVGCGAGVFGKSLIDQKGCRVVGVEQNSAAFVEAEHRLHKVVNAAFDDTIDFNSEMFDAIFFNDVLEHILHPAAALSFARTLLNPGGVIISSIPNLRYFAVLKDLVLNKSFQYQDAGVLDKTHLRFFTTKTIRTMYEEAELEVVLHEGINKTDDRKSNLLAKLLPSLFEDIVYLQFATVAKLKTGSL